jgi:hypothetical protein
MSPYLRAVEYSVETRGPTGRIARGLGQGRRWETTPDLIDLGFRLRSPCSAEFRFLEDAVQERRQAEIECRKLAMRHEAAALTRARLARHKLAEARRQSDALVALRLRDAAGTALREAAEHRGMAMQIRRDIAVEHWQDDQARRWSPPRRRRGRPPRSAMITHS